MFITGSKSWVWCLRVWTSPSHAYTKLTKQVSHSRLNFAAPSHCWSYIPRTRARAVWHNSTSGYWRHTIRSIQIEEEPLFWISICLSNCKKHTRTISSILAHMPLCYNRTYTLVAWSLDILWSKIYSLFVWLGLFVAGSWRSTAGCFGMREKYCSG